MTKLFHKLELSDKEENISPERKKKAAIAAGASALFAGAGYIVQKEYLRGALYALVEAAFILLFIFWGKDAIAGFFSLGEVPMRDHSLVFLVYGILAFIVLGAFLVFWAIGIIETYRNGIKITDENYERPSRKEAFREWLHEKTHVLFLAPGVAAIALVVLIPLVFSICIAFTNYDASHQPPRVLIEWVGLQNFKDLLTLGSYATTFFGILGWTLIWTVCSSVFPYGLGILLAVLLNYPRLKGKKIYKTIFILPWAIPAYISLLVLQTMFDTGYGLINQILELFGGSGVPWLTQTTPARCALILVSVWTGFSYPMMLSENIIKNIDREIYEAAALEGATGAKAFFHITLPLLMFSISPIFIMSLAGAFNNFNTIFLLTGGGPLNLDYQSAGSTDILITWLFKMTINNNKYNFGAAISLILFILVAIFSIFQLRKTRAFKEEDNNA